jgi:RES domain-containing protein
MPERITGWRITQSRYADEAFSGEGARRYGGRWNGRGTAVAYAAGSRSLALLEVLVHLDSTALLRRYVLVPVHFDAAHVERIPRAELPADWRAHPAPASTQALGDAFIEAARTPVLQVPSVIVPAEPNYVLNPRHPDFGAVDIGAPEPLDVDGRLFEQSG